MRASMAFDETKQIFRAIYSDKQKVAAIFSAATLAFAYWRFLPLLKTWAFYTHWVSLLQLVPLAIMGAVGFVNGNAHLVAIKNDWLKLSFKTHITIVITAVSAVLIVHFFLFVKRCLNKGVKMLKSI